MSSVKSRKMNLLVIRLIAGVTGVLMFAFQNCSRVDTLQISDIAGKAVATNEFAGNNNTDENVNVQIELASGDVLAVDPVGNETVVNNNNNNSNGGGSSDPGQAVQQPVSDQPILVTGDDEIKVEDVPDLDVCVAQEQIKKGDRRHEEDEDEDHHGDREGHRYGSRDDDDREHHERNKSAVASYKRIKCKVKKDKKHDGPRCLDLARENGMNVIDIAKLEDVSLIKSLKGKTLIMSSDSSISSIRGLMIENAVGKTILCGISITRLDVKKGNLEMREGASVKSCGEINGRIYKDDRSSIDGSDSE